MISNETQEKLVEILINRIEQLNEYILKEIGKKIKRIGNMTPSEAYQIQQILKYGGDLDKILEKIAKVTNLNVQDIYKIFEEEAKINQNFAKKLYDARNVSFIPYAKNQVLQNQVRAIARITAGQYVNLSRTMVFANINSYGNIVFSDIAKTYQDTIDKAILSLTQGKEVYQQVMRKSMRELASHGINTVDYASGRTRRLDSAVRMNILDGMRDMSNTLQKQFGEEYGADGIEISVHNNPAPDHADIQGHQFTNEEFEKFQQGLTAEDYEGRIYQPVKDGKNRRPISAYNCYHYIFCIILGISKPEYTQKELNEINSDNEKGFTYEGKKYTMYEGAQLQRQIETEIRKQKDLQIAGKAINDKEMIVDAQMKIDILRNKYNELSRVSGLPTKIQRLYVAGYKKVNTN